MSRFDAFDPCGPQYPTKRRFTPDIRSETIERAREGDRVALGNILTAFERNIRSTVRRWSGRRTVRGVDDVAQDVFLKVHRNFPQFRSNTPRQLRMWIEAIARNYCLDLQRVRRPPMVPLEQHGDADEPLDLQAEDPTPVDEVVSREQCQVIRLAVDSLSNKLKEAFTLREYENLSYAEIASEAGINEITARTRVLRAREALRPHLASLIEEL